VKQRLERLRIKIARLLLRDTGMILVPEAEVKRVDELCKELQQYAVHSGALRDPHRVRARKRIDGMTNELLVLGAKLKEEAAQ
jgi:hypothetical protein